MAGTSKARTAATVTGPEEKTYMKSTATDWAALDARTAAQDVREAELRAQSFTGVSFCLDTGDYAGYLNGRIVTWARTYTEAEARLGVQMAGHSWAARS